MNEKEKEKEKENEKENENEICEINGKQKKNNYNLSLY